MVNVIIYLKKEHDAKEVVKFLLEKKLIASASIDENNVSYKLENDQFSEVVYSVITSQSKSLLFSEIVKALEAKTGEDTAIISVPIVASNKIFDDTIRSSTMLI